MKAVVAAFNQEKALVGAFSVITNLRIELFWGTSDEPDIFLVLSSNLTDYLPQVIKIMSISTGDKSVDLPSLNIEHNYPHLLSELVMKL